MKRMLFDVFNVVPSNSRGVERVSRHATTLQMERSHLKSNFDLNVSKAKAQRCRSSCSPTLTFSHNLKLLFLVLDQLFSFLSDRPV